MGPLAAIYAQLLNDALNKRFEGGYYSQSRPHGGLLEDRDLPPGIGPRAYRDPQQAGPSPPTQAPLAAMFRGNP